MARPRARDFDAKRHGLLVEAARVFAAMGMERASMAQIASAAGVSKSLLYHYYPSKDALIFAIISTHLEALDTALETADDPAAPPEERLRGLVGTVLEAYRGADDFHNVQLNAQLPAVEQAEIRAIERRIVRRFSEVIAEVHPGLDEGEKKRLMPVTMSLFGMMNWVYMWFHDGGPITRDSYADLATALILDGVRGLR
ncbi:TetR/AcrR family transcriptional regulator [Roseivivax sediminis]|uniref:DNA-binding transcriptional regulator, AcrR family n=1 Tax=Roseivivax sediminis TaxID=936889 RepID=A0A1I2CFB2_9RHOB|nr:TetR/AcrR family transcriptional regulator [Roseivivax sediminis]SFE66948.1 DNA-binding transcriptional regulator, AcrR family [Roseivivax sediminis]